MPGTPRTYDDIIAQTVPEPPRTWIDPDTGHRIVRLTDEPGLSTGPDLNPAPAPHPG